MSGHEYEDLHEVWTLKGVLLLNGRDFGRYQLLMDRGRFRARLISQRMRMREDVTDLPYEEQEEHAERIATEEENLQRSGGMLRKTMADEVEMLEIFRMLEDTEFVGDMPEDESEVVEEYVRQRMLSQKLGPVTS